MTDNLTTTYSLLDEVAKRRAQYPTDDAEAVDQAWRELGVALTVLLISLDNVDVVDGVNETFAVAKRLSDKISMIGAMSNG